MKRLALLFALSASLFCVAAAQAHRIPRADAESRWYFLMKDQCDIGGTCDVRNYFLRCTAGAPHSYNCTYEYRQRRSNPPFGIEYRYCTVYGVLKHTTAISSTRNCGAWS